MKLLFFSIHLFFLLVTLGNKPLQKVVKPSISIDSCISLCRIYVLKDFDSALYFADLAIEYSKDISDNQQKARAIGNRIFVEIQRDVIQADENFFKENLEKLRQLDSPSILADAENNYGGFLYRNERYYDALQMYQSSLEYDLKQTGDSVGIAKSYNNIAGILGAMGREEDALRYYHLSNYILANSNAKDNLFKNYLNMSLFFGDKAKNRLNIYNPDSAIYYAELALTETERMDFPMGIAFAKGALANAYIQDAIILKANASKVLKLAQESKAFFRSNPLSPQYNLALVHEAYAYLALGKLKEAIATSNQISEDKSIKREVLLLKYEIDKMRKRYDKALYTFQQIKQMDDSLNYRSQRAKTAELQAQYEAKQQAEQINELSKKASIQSLEIRTKNQWLLVGGVSFLLVISLATAGYFRLQQRNTQQRIEKIEIEQRFLLAQLNPHFIFNALDSIQNFMLKNNAGKAGFYLGKFAKLMRQVLENSRESFILLEDEIAMLENYMEIHRLQSEKPFSYCINIASEIAPEEFKIPPMFVQPFVENAIQHGLVKGYGNIEVNFSLEQKLIAIEIVDDGVGIGQVNRGNKGYNSMATSIIAKRIENYNERLKTNISLSFNENKSPFDVLVGTQVALKVPFKLI